MAVLLACAILPPWVASAPGVESVVRAWATRVREQAGEVADAHSMLLAMTRASADALGPTLAEMKITPVVPSECFGGAASEKEFSYERGDDAIADAAMRGETFLDEDTARRCFGFPIAARLAFLDAAVECCAAHGWSTDRTVIWFIGIEAKNPGSTYHLAKAFGLVQRPATCVVLPQPEPVGAVSAGDSAAAAVTAGASAAAAPQTKVIIDLPPARKGEPAPTAILDFDYVKGMRMGRAAGEPIPIRAPAINGFDWALATLTTLSLGRFAVGQVPVTSAWLGEDSAARSSGKTRAGEDYAWFWSVNKKVTVLAIY